MGNSVVFNGYNAVCEDFYCISHTFHENYYLYVQSHNPEFTDVKYEWRQLPEHDDQLKGLATFRKQFAIDFIKHNEIPDCKPIKLRYIITPDYSFN